nr:peptidase M20 [Tanacetum cinerariifolium]
AVSGRQGRGYHPGDDAGHCAPYSGGGAVGVSSNARYHALRVTLFYVGRCGLCLFAADTRFSARQFASNLVWLPAGSHAHLYPPRQYWPATGGCRKPQLLDWLRIPSVSADPKFHGDVLRAADFIKDKLLEAGATLVEICPTAGNPIVYGEYMAGPDRPTVLVYGHYDVQPADPYELWTSPPFEPVIKDEKIYARGACDDKGQVYMHVKALEMMLRDGGLGAPCNIKFMFEGEEEIGSDNLGIFVKANKEK